MVTHPFAPIEGAEAPPTLSDLAASARGHDGAAAETLMGRVRHLAVRYARARLSRFGAHDLSQDVAQEVCLAVHAALPTYDERGLPFEAFVYSVASHKVADAQRHLIRGPQLVADLPDSEDITAGPEGAAVIRDEAHRALQLIRTLPTRHQEILRLRVAVGMSAEETAAALGMSPGAIRVAQHRALVRLRGLISASQDPRHAHHSQDSERLAS